jgi:hypothetical protein
MPIISTEKTFVNGEPFTKVIRVLRDGLFRIKMPPCIEESIGIGEIDHETRAGVDKKFKEVVAKYIASKTYETKVIIYQFKLSGLIQGPAHMGEFFREGEDDPMEKICLFRGDDFSFDNGMIVGIKAKVYIESRNEREDGEVYYRYKRVDNEDDLPLGMLDNDCNMLRLQHRGDQISGGNRMEWTQERHDFFVSLYHAMSQLILKIKHLTEPEGLLAAINNQRRITFTETPRDAVTTERTW